jgi:hypothetical protein
MQERWRELKGYRETYLISDRGVVKTKDRIGTRNNSVRGRELTQRDNSNGYLRVNVRLAGEEKSREHLVHRLVAKAFIPEVDGKPYINHIDGNKHNNSVSNLERCSKSENELHAHRIGLKKTAPLKGELHGGRIFDRRDVESIRNEYIKGDKEHGQCALARKYGTSQSHIYQIVTNKIWE